MKFSALFKKRSAFSVQHLAIALFLFSIFYILHSATPAHAASHTIPSPTMQQTNFNTASNVPDTLHNRTQVVMLEVMSSLTCQLVGIDPMSPNRPCLGIADQVSGKIGFLPSPNSATEKSQPQVGGAIGGMGNMIAALYKPPLHTVDYFQNLAQDFGITKKTYAQTTGLPAEASAKAGTGFQGLTPLLGIWTAFRNIVYLIFVIIFVVIGFAIMLRVKIDPRTVMTIQNQIPKIIIGILLVTFSFAIAGFFIDLMWVMIYLVFGLISGISTEVATGIQVLNPAILQGKTPLDALSGEFNTYNLNNMAHEVAQSSVPVIWNVLGITPKLTDAIIGLGSVFDLLGFITHLLPSPLKTDAGTPANFLIDLVSGAASIFAAFKVITFPPPTVAGTGPGWLTNLPASLPVAAVVYPLVQEFLRVALPYLIVYIIIFLSLFIALFRLWFTLLMAYVQILIDVALAPFWIMGGLVPGSPISAGGWIRDLIANLAAFPATILMFLLGKVFMDAFSKASHPFAPPLIGDLGNPQMFSPLIGIGIILMTPNVVSMLKAALKAPKIDAAGGFGKGIGAGAGILGGVSKSTAGATSAYLVGDPLTGKKSTEGLKAALTRKLFG